MKVLVTGANGLLGSNIVKELAGRGIEVRIMVRETAGMESLQRVSAETFTGKITDPLDVENATRDCDIVIHSAAETRQGLCSIKKYERVNLEGTLNVLNAALKNGVRRVIYISSANTVGYGTTDKPGREEYPASRPFMRSNYVSSKMAAEDMVRSYFKEKGLGTIIINPTFMLGQGGSEKSSNRIILMGYNARLMVIPPGGKNFVHVRDVAVAACNAIEKGREGEKYLAAGENLSYLQFYRKMDLVTGRTRRYLVVHPILLKLAGIPGTIARLAGMDSELDLVNANLLCIKNYYSADRAVKELGMPVSSMEMAIKDSISWQKEIGNIKQ